jgi:hypothetical protein
MRYVVHAFFVLTIIGLVIPAAALAGKGGGKGGGGRPSFAGGQGGGPKWSRQSTGGKQTQTSGKTLPGGKDKPQHAAKSLDKPSHDKAHQHKLASKKDGTSLTDSGEAYNKKQKQLEIEQRNRDKRLAQADHLRQIAERNGNENLAANADRMEAFAHDHYARRVSQLEKFGVTDPALDPGGVTDPLTDPAGEFAELPLLP